MLRMRMNDIQVNGKRLLNAKNRELKQLRMRIKKNKNTKHKEVEQLRVQLKNMEVKIREMEVGAQPVLKRKRKLKPRKEKTTHEEKKEEKNKEEEQEEEPDSGIDVQFSSSGYARINLHCVVCKKKALLSAICEYALYNTKEERFSLMSTKTVLVKQYENGIPISNVFCSLKCLDKLYPQRSMGTLV